VADLSPPPVEELPRERRETAVALLKTLVTRRETKLSLRTEKVLGGVEGDPAEKQAVLNGLRRVT
jgi:hypothetical protein